MKSLPNKPELSSVRMAVIMDDFTYHSYAPECHILQLSPENWQEELENFEPDFLFIESAWRGKDEKWKNKIGHISRELVGIVNWCKNNTVPTCFWNKEDPVHFSTFLNVATLFDVIFTTDIDCVSQYKKQLKHESVYLLPFACQPLVNNPIELEGQRLDAVCFAGAYYDQYPERNANFNSMIDNLQSFKDIDIFDRNFGKNMPGYMFPEEYKHIIKGTLPFDQIDRAYKGYYYSINLNSVKNSQSMFARRAYELMASNTVVLSNFSKGLRLMFGDLVVCSDSGEAIADKVKAFDNDIEFRDKVRLISLRKAIEQHTYKERLRFIVDKLTNITYAREQFDVVVMSVTNNEEETRAVIDMFEAQSYQDKKLVIFANYRSRTASTDNISIIPKGRFPLRTHNRKELANYISPAQWLSVFDVNDFYGQNYLRDLINATQYTDAHVIGKGATYLYEGDSFGVSNSGDEYRYIKSIPPRQAIAKFSRLNITSVKELFSLAFYSYKKKLEVLSIDRFNYCRNGRFASLEKLSNVRDLESFNKGLSIDEMLSIDCPGGGVNPHSITAKYLCSSFMHHRTGALRTQKTNKALIINSSLDKKSHKYIHANKPYLISDFSLEQNTLNKVILNGATQGDCRIVLSLLNKEKQEVAKNIIVLNEESTLDIPSGVEYIDLSIRIRHPGKTRIFSLDFEPLLNRALESEDSKSEINFASLLSNKEDGDLSYSTSDGAIKLSSSLTAEKHQYIYSNDIIESAALFDANKQTHCVFVKASEESVNANLVLIYLDKDNNRLEHAILPCNQNISITLPEQTENIRLGFRMRGAGVCAFEHVRTKVKQTYNKASEAIIDVPTLKVMFTKCKTSNVKLSFENDELGLMSSLSDQKHEYINSPIKQDISLLKDNCLSESNELDIYLQATSGLYLNLVVYYFDSYNTRIAHDMVPTNKNFKLTIPDNASSFSLGFRALNGGNCTIEEIAFAKRILLPSKIIGSSDTLVLTNHYPSYENIYRNAFVHTRVKAYKEKEANVDVMRFWPNTNVSYHEYEGVDVVTGGSEALEQLIESGDYKNILIHFLNEEMWDVLKLYGNLKICIWLHGSEIQPWWRRKALYESKSLIAKAEQNQIVKNKFWSSVFSSAMENKNIKLVFVSNYLANSTFEDYGVNASSLDYLIIANPIKTELFKYKEKNHSSRKKILSIRPYASKIYANDLAVNAVLELSHKDFFDELEFTFIGDGELFEETLSPIAHFSNVTIERKFLSQADIACKHLDYGIFLCPSRMDTQGVSRDEAMSSGLVPVCSSVAAVLEFVDSESAIIAEEENYKDLALGIENLYLNTDLFSALSKGAAERVRQDRSHSLIVQKEISIFI